MPSRRTVNSIPGRGFVSAINVYICSIVLGGAGGYVPGRSATYENQALSVKVIPQSWTNLKGIDKISW